MESSPLRLGLILSKARLLGLLRVEDSDLVPFLENGCRLSQKRCHFGN